MDINNNNINQLSDFISQIMEMPEESAINGGESIIGAINGAFTPAMRRSTIKDILQEFRNNGLSRADIQDQMLELHSTFDGMVEELKPSAAKKKILEEFFQLFYDLYSEAYNMYLTCDIELPIKLENGASLPTYAHESDAAADLSVYEDIELPPHSLGNKVRTGIRIGLPEGWVAYLAPRSSIGAKTPLRLSNELGIIDSGYRGEILVLLDNLSDSEYTLQAGTRIAQLWVRPVYKFKPIEVSELDTTERGEGGFGSTGQ